MWREWVREEREREGNRRGTDAASWYCDEINKGGYVEGVGKKEGEGGIC